MLGQSNLKEYVWWLSCRRRGKFKSAFRLALQFVVGAWAQLCFSKVPASQNVDLLFVHPSIKSKKQNRKAKLLHYLNRSNKVVCEVVAYESDELSQKPFVRPDKNTPFQFVPKAGYANFLIEKYKPSVIVMERYDEILSFYLRLYGRRCGAKTVQLAHSIPSDDSDKFLLNNFDYYFVFGKSSVRKLMNKHMRFGSSRVVPIGSYMNDGLSEVKSGDSNKVMILAMGAGWSKFEDKVEEMYERLLAWIGSRADLDFYVKLHPASSTGFWERVPSTLHNITVLEQKIPMVEALSRVSVVVNMHSNACIDVASYHKPVLYYNDLPVGDEFDQSKFFSVSSLSETGLSEAYEKIMTNYDFYVERSKEFYRYHMENENNGCRSISEALLSLCDGKENFSCHQIEHEFQNAGKNS